MREGANKGYNTQPGWLFGRGVKQIKERKMPQSYCLNAYAKCDLKRESKQILEK